MGGDGPCVSAPNLQNLPSCAGASGAVTKIKDGKQERILTDLPSIALRPIGSDGAGTQDIQFDSGGNPYLLIGYAGLPASRDPALNPSWGNLYSVDFNTGSLIQRLLIA